MFENDVDGFEYSARGSCFLCRYMDFDFVVTAKHVTDGFKADSIRVLFYQSSKNFVPYNAKISIRSQDCDIATNSMDEDTDWQDITIFPLERSLYCDEDFADQKPYLIPSEKHIWHSGLDGQFVLRGFPHGPSGINYDARILYEQAVQLEADLVGTASMEHCYEIKFRDLSPCSDLDGLRGTPVFWIGNDKPRNHRLAGIIIRATHASATGYFLHANVIVNVLDRAVAAQHRSILSTT